MSNTINEEDKSLIPFTLDDFERDINDDYISKFVEPIPLILNCSQNHIL